MSAMVLQLNQAALHGPAHPRKGPSSFYILCNGRNSKVVYNAEQQFDEDQSRIEEMKMREFERRNELSVNE